MGDVNIWYFHSIKIRTDCKQDMNSRSWMLLSLQQRSISLNWCARWRAFSLYLGASLWKLAELRPASLQKSEKVSKKNKYAGSICYVDSDSGAGVLAPYTNPALNHCHNPPHQQACICMSTLSSQHILITVWITTFIASLNWISQSSGDCEKMHASEHLDLEHLWLKYGSCAPGCVAVWLSWIFFSHFGLDFNIIFYLQLPLTSRWKIVTHHFISPSTSWLSITADSRAAELLSSC